MSSDLPHVSAIILNWNGEQETIECLESVLKSDYANLNVVIVDNNSSDESIERIKSWATGEEPEILTLFPNLVFPTIEKPAQLYELIIKGEISASFIKEQISDPIPPGSIVLAKNNENSGFAVGNNLGIRISKVLFDNGYYLLLNNDTVIEKKTISRLVEELEANRTIGAATSAVYHYSNRVKIANFGGKITFFAKRRYYTRPSGEELKPITFTTACALMVRGRVFEKVGLLSSQFFFGEEDFEFSWRLRKNKVPMVCVTKSKVYHKTSISADRLFTNNIQKKFLYVFNRIIDMKINLVKPIWHTWRFFLLKYIFMWLVVKYKVRILTAINFVKELRRHTDKYNDARKSTVETITKGLNL